MSTAEDYGGRVLPRRRFLPQPTLRRLREEKRLPAPLTQAQRRFFKAAADRIVAERELHRDDPIPF